MTNGTDWTPDICIYHDPCDDGFAAAWCVWRKWGNEVDFRPTNYGLPVPDDRIDGKNILIVDFSFKPDVMERLAERASQIVMLDHHKTAKEDCESLPCEIVGANHTNVTRTFARVSGPPLTRVLVEFDMKRSGAMMAWSFCFPDDDVPDFIRHVQDRDLWKFEMEDTKAFTAWLRSHPRDFGHWDGIEDDFLARPEKCINEGAAILRARTLQVAAIANTATPRKIGGFDGVPVAASPYDFVSEVAHELLQRNPDAPFAACMVDAYGERTWSLRSEDDREDVSAIAKSFGGGGHRNAAGFRVPA